MASGPIPSWQIEGQKVEAVINFIFLGSRVTIDGDCSHKRHFLFKELYDFILIFKNIKKHRHPFADKGLYSQSYGFSSSHIWMWELDHKEGWAQKNWCLLTVAKTFESPLDSKEIKPVDPKGNQPRIFIGGTDAEAEVTWWKSRLIGKNPYVGKDWRQKEKEAAKDKMVRQHHQFNAHELEQTPLYS